MPRAGSKNLIGEEGPGFKIIMPEFNSERIGIGGEELHGLRARRPRGGDCL